MVLISELEVFLASSNCNNSSNAGLAYLNSNNELSNANENTGFRNYRHSKTYLLFEEEGDDDLATWQKTA